MDCGVQARPVSGVKRGLEDSPCTSSAKRLTTPQPLASKTSLASPRGAKRSIPFDDVSWRSPAKLHKQGSLEHVRPYMLQQQQRGQQQQQQRQQLQELPVQAPIPLPPGLQEDMETDDDDADRPNLPATSCQQQQQQQQQSACAWGSMFGRLGLGEASSSRTTPLYGMASENKRPPGRPITLTSPSVPSLLAPAEPQRQQKEQEQQQQGAHMNGAACLHQQQHPMHPAQEQRAPAAHQGVSFFSREFMRCVSRAQNES